MKRQTLSNKVRIKGRLEIFEYRQGEKVKVLEANNLVVNVGLEHIADRIQNNVQTPMSHIAVGTGSTPVTATDTTLQTELFRKINSNITATDNQYTIETDIDETEALGTWREAGIFNNSVGGTMLNRLNFTYVKGGQSVNVKFTITFTST